MRRLFALLASVTAAFVAAAAPVAADPGAPATSAPATPPSASSVPNDALGLSPAAGTGSGLAVTLDAGASEEHDVVVSNHTANLRLVVRISATDATGTLGTAAASWLAFGDDAIQLDPHAATTVPMTVAVPHDTQPGSALAHVSATVQSAVSAADGSPVAGTATATFPVSIVVSGTPTAQIAIADVHRVDEGSKHQLAVVLRNFGAQGAQVSGHVIVAGDTPQTLPFHATLGASRDTTVDLDWQVPSSSTPSDVAVDVEYGDGNVASWSSQLGGSPTDLSSTSGPSTPSTTASATDAVSPTVAPASSKPWWKQQSPAAILAILAVLAAGAWFAFEMRASRRGRRGVPGLARAPDPAGGIAWATPAAGPSEDAVELAKQIVRLTDAVVQLVESQRAGEGHSAVSRDARAGPAPPAPVPVPEPPPASPPEVRAVPESAESRSASSTPGASSRVQPDDPRADAMARLVELDRQRRRLREWMDSEDSGMAFESEIGAADPER